MTTASRNSMLTVLTVFWLIARVAFGASSESTAKRGTDVGTGVPDRKLPGRTEELDKYWAGAERWNALRLRRGKSPGDILTIARIHHTLGQWALAADAYDSFVRKYSLLPLWSSSTREPDRKLLERSREALLNLGWCRLMSGDLRRAQAIMKRYKEQYPEFQFQYPVQRLQFFIGFRYMQIAAQKMNRKILEDWFVPKPGSVRAAQWGFSPLDSGYALLLSDPPRRGGADPSPESTAYRIFRDIVHKDSRSVFADQALFCIGVLQRWLHSPKSARETFLKLVGEKGRYSQSPMRPFANVECAEALLDIQPRPLYNSQWDEEALRRLREARKLLAGSIGPIKKKLHALQIRLRRRYARRSLARAEFYIANREFRAAEIVLETIIRDFSETRYAISARAYLKKIRGAR